MPMYALGIVPIIHELASIEVLQMWYAGDASQLEAPCWVSALGGIVWFVWDLILVTFQIQSTLMSFWTVMLRTRCLLGLVRWRNFLRWLPPSHRQHIQPSHMYSYIVGCILLEQIFSLEHAFSCPCGSFPSLPQWSLRLTAGLLSEVCCDVGIEPALHP